MTSVQSADSMDGDNEGASALDPFVDPKLGLTLHQTAGRLLSRNIFSTEFELRLVSSRPITSG